MGVEPVSLGSKKVRMSLGIPDDEYRRELARWPLEDVLSALGSIDAGKFPERYRWLLGRKRELVEIEKGLLARFNAEERLPVSIRFRVKGSGPIQLTLGEFSIRGWREFEIQKDGASHLAIRPPRLLDGHGESIGTVAIHNGIDTDRYSILITMGEEEIRVVEKGAGRGLFGLFGGKRNYLIRTKSEYLGLIRAESFENNIGIEGTFGEGARHYLWVLLFFIATFAKAHYDPDR